VAITSNLRYESQMTGEDWSPGTIGTPVPTSLF
jgi:hypothetical protein